MSTKLNRKKSLLFAITLLLGCASCGVAQITLLDSFDIENFHRDPKIGFNPLSGNVLVTVGEFSQKELAEYSVDGTFLQSFGNFSLAFGGFDVVTEPIVVNGISVPAGSLIFMDGFINATRSFDLETGLDSLLGLFLPAGNNQAAGIGLDSNGGRLVHGDSFFNQFAMFDYETDQLSFASIQSPAHVGFDFDILAATQTAFTLPFSPTPVVNEVALDGTNLESIDLAPFGLQGRLSSISFNDEAGEAWIINEQGTVYRLGGFPAVPEPASFLLSLSGLLAMLLIRRKR